MEQAILKTLIYADIFDYPLKAYEIHKWLIGRKAILRQVEKALQRLSQKGKVKSKLGYYFLPGKSRLVAKRLKRENESKKFFRKAKSVVWFLKFIPYIKLIGISGGVAMENADKTDDIDLFIITSKNGLWLTRILITTFLNSMGVRRKAGMKLSQVAGKLCLNILLEEDRLAQNKADIYLAHEVLQMKVLWQRNGIYQKYLEDNQWVFEFLPNWVGGARGPASSRSRRASSIANAPAATRREPFSLSPLADLLENLAKKFQLKIMKKPVGMERIQDGALYFHPNDRRGEVLKEYKARIKTIP